MPSRLAPISTEIIALLVIVPIPMRWSRAIFCPPTLKKPGRSGSSITRSKRGYARRLSPPRTTKSRHQPNSSSVRLRYDQAVRSSCFIASASKPPPAATVTRCCTATSSGRSSGSRLSISLRFPASRAAAKSSTSSAFVGTPTMRDF